ncbi:alpha/beta hydrolase [Neolewinella antarctica]|uniref:Pimeloyl-ACP methyl ester carboxylesterase n=1 Tax=Neolewinella antarctica TaxID=442734 RepID=A0ABX0X6R4_9BACT|nr:alpha/beta hydrolase [Neolewinella antarctica]NJC24557.1 pimeloyl-ACP methyl ester carboxylesterase [Neolewinella antarctica]
MKKILIGLAVLLILLYLGVTYFFSGLILHTPDRDIATVYQMNKERWDWDLDSIVRTLPNQEEISFVSPYDGITLRGWSFTPEGFDCGVVFSHGYSMNRANMLKYTPIFRDCNCAMLLYDHRGHGASDEAYGSGGDHEAMDLIAASKLLQERTGLSMKGIGWYGESWGASTVILAADRATEKPAWIIAESPFADWYSAVMERGLKDYGNGLKLLTPGAFAWIKIRDDVDFNKVSMLEAMPRLEMPMLLFHSQSDTLTSPEQSDRLAAAASKKGSFVYHPLDWGAWHAHNIIWRPEEYRNLVLNFVGDFCE